VTTREEARDDMAWAIYAEEQEARKQARPVERQWPGDDVLRHAIEDAHRGDQAREDDTTT
jgi:hypothetical protein